MSDRSDKNGGPEIDRSATEARQSERGLGLIYVLGGGILLAVVVWAGIELLVPGSDDPGVGTVNENAGQAAPDATGPAQPSQ